MHSCQHLRPNCNQSSEVIICVSQQVFVSCRLILRCTGRSCISDRHTDTVWNDLPASSLCMPSFMKSSLASWRTRVTLRETAFSNQSRKFLLQLSGLFWSLCGSMLISLRGRSLPGFTPPSPWTGPNQPENVDNVGSAWLQGDKHTEDLNQRAEADRCVASLQTDRCSAARWHDPNSNSEEELNVSPYFNATLITSF